VNNSAAQKSSDRGQDHGQTCETTCDGVQNQGTGGFGVYHDDRARCIGPARSLDWHRSEDFVAELGRCTSHRIHRNRVPLGRRSERMRIVLDLYEDAYLMLAVVPHPPNVPNWTEELIPLLDVDALNR
jgi:hypothetical protein